MSNYAEVLMKSMRRPKGCVASIAVGIERSLLRVFPNVAITVYPRPYELRFELHVQVMTLNGRQAELKVMIDEYAAEEPDAHEYVIRDAVRQVVYFVIESNPRSFM